MADGMGTTTLSIADVPVDYSLALWCLLRVGILTGEFTMNELAEVVKEVVNPDAKARVVQKAPASHCVWVVATRSGRIAPARRLYR